MTKKSSDEAAVAIRKRGSVWTIFRHADGVDVMLMVVGFIAAVGDGLTAPLKFYIFAGLMNNIGRSSTSNNVDLFTNKINQSVLALCILAAGAGILCFLEGYCWTRTAERQASRMRCRYLRAVLRHDVAYFDLDVATTSKVTASISSDSLTIQDAISEKVPSFVMNISTFLGSYLIAFLLIWRLALAAFPFVVFLIIPGMIYGRVLMRLAKRQMIQYNEAGNIAQQAISSIRTVYSFVGENKTMTKFSTALEGSVKLGLKQGLAKGVAIGSNGVIFAVSAFNHWYGSRLVMYHGAQGGYVYSTIALLMIGGLSLGSILPSISNISDAAAVGEHIMKVIKIVPEIDSENMEGLTLETITGEVEFKHIEFAYPSRPDTIILQDLCLLVPSNKTIALVGQSGSGKSTLTYLLQRFYDPLAGEVLLDGVPIHKLQLKWLRSQMGLVSQEPALFATTIKENILFGKEDATMEEIVEAAKLSNAHNFITNLPDGYDTQVGEGGIQISGGEKQRIAIARAIIKKPLILLLDEATSALDFESERVVQDALDKAVIGRTTIMIAHRLSTIQNADLIAVIKNGKVVELGSPEELLKNEEGLYTSFVSLQHRSTAECQDDIISPFKSSTSHLNTTNNNDPVCGRSNANCITVDCSNSGPVVPLNIESKGDIVNPKPSYWRLLALSKRELKHTISGCFAAILLGAIQPCASFILGSMVSVYFLQDHEEIKRQTMIYTSSFLVICVLMLVLNICQFYSFAYTGEHLIKRVREMMFNKMLTFEVGWFDQSENSSGSLCSRLAKDPNVVKSLVADQMGLLVRTISVIVLAFTITLVIAWRLAIVMIPLQPLTIACFYIRLVLLKTMSKEANKAQEQSGKLAAEAVTNHRTITAFSSQDRVLNILKTTQQGPRKESIRQSWYAGLVLAFSQTISTCALALTFWYGGKLLSQGYISGKGFIQTFIILTTASNLIALSGSMTTDLANGANVIKSVFSILDRVTEIIPDHPEGYKVEKIGGRIEIQDVDFSYPSRPDIVIFRGFSLSMEAGKSTALVGQSGSGKSTIIALIERFYDPVQGAIYIDGRDIRTYNLRSLRRHIALVSQEPTLFGGTIRENIVYGIINNEISEFDVIEAAKAAHAHEFISGLKDGYDTWCGDSGPQLSGGQKQRIAIARAILRNPSILLLDEATSALDNESERIVQDALERLMVGRTSVVVAHRLSTIKNCDLIAVLDKGKVVEKGTHFTLMDRGPQGAYYSLMNHQAKT